MNFLTSELGYDINYTSTDYKSGDAADMGNYIAETIINYGLSDGSNELNNYENLLFIGMQDEFDDLKKEIPNLQHHNCKDFLEMATLIPRSKFIKDISSTDIRKQQKSQKT